MKCGLSLDCRAMHSMLNKQWQAANHRCRRSRLANGRIGSGQAQLAANGPEPVIEAATSEPRRSTANRPTTGHSGTPIACPERHTQMHGRPLGYWCSTLVLH